MATAEQGAWVERVLGLTLAGGAAAPDADRPKLMPIWRDAKEKVDGAITRLQAALRATDDDDLQQIADYGLYGVTTGQAVRLMAALQDADNGGGAPDALAKVAGAVDDYRDYLEGAPIVALLESNPWQNVPLRQVLGGALNQLERLAAA